MQKLFLSLLFTSVFHLAFAQSATVQGTVSDGNTPLAYATVSLDGLHAGSYTDEVGQYSFTDLPAGSYVVQASYVGYEPLQQQITLAEGQHLTLHLTLAPTATLSEEIVVTGTMKPTYVKDSPVKVDVITARQLETYLPLAATSVVEGMQLVNGIQEVIACGVCFTNSISINGLPGPYTAVLMDGTPMYGNLASVYGLNGIPSMIIDRFEVIKGPNSTLYGSEAVAGVINIITKDPAEQPALAIDIMGTSHLESFGNVALAPRIGKTHGYIGLNYAYLNDFDDDNGDGFGDGISMDRYSVFTKWNIARASEKPFSIAAKYYYEDRRNGVEAFLADRAYRTLRGSDSVYGESIYTNRVELFGTYVPHTSLPLKLDYSVSHHDQDSYYGSDHYTARQDIAFANLTWNTSVSRHDLLVGLTGRYQNYDDNTVATATYSPAGDTLNAIDRQWIPGVFVQDEWKLNDRFTLLSGLRLDHYSRHGFILAPRLSTKYRPGDWTTVRANFGTGFRIVNLFTEDHAFLTGQREVSIVEALEPERSYNGSLNVNHVYAGLGGTGTLDVEAYYTYFNNKIVPDYDTPGKIIYANSSGYARTRGIGATVTHTFSFPLGINIGGNWQRATETEVSATGESTTRRIEFAPRWSGVLTANYAWKTPGLTFAYTARWTGPMALPEVFDLGADGTPLPQPRPTTSAPFSLHNLQVTKVFGPTCKLYAGIQNLYNFRQASSPLIGFNDPAAPVGFSDYFDTSYAYAPNHGREFYLGVQWSLK